jgi:hypothetical protein
MSKFKENELVNHPRLGKVRIFENDEKYSLVKILSPNLKKWNIERVQSKLLTKIK